MSNREHQKLSGQSLAFLVLRGWLGVRALLTGIEKYSVTTKIKIPLVDPESGMEDPSGAMIEATQKVYGFGNYHAIPQVLQDKFATEPMLPKFATAIFYPVLGPLLIALGLMLLVGLGTRLSLLLQGLLYIGLTVGLILIKQDDGVAWLGIHIAVIAMALAFVDNNRFALLKKW